MGLGMVFLLDNGLLAHTIIHGKGHARYFRLVKCKDSGIMQPALIWVHL